MWVKLLAGWMALTVAHTSIAGALGEPEGNTPQIPQLSSGEGRQVADKLAGLLERRYTIPSVGRVYAQALRNGAASGRYDRLNWKQFCDLLTSDLQAAHPDKHLFVNAGVPVSPGAKPSPMNRAPATQAGQWASARVAYLRLNRFTGELENASEIRRFMIKHQKAKALILDLRGHRGGRFEEMDAIIPFLYAHRTPLLDMAIARQTEEENGPLAQSPSLEMLANTGSLIVRRHWAVPDAKYRGLQKTRLFVLTSKVTGSAGEHLAAAFKASRRATLIGERTAGANHFGGEVPITSHFYAFIPMGRTYDPRTGEDWEGRGVASDVVVPSSEALSTALKAAGLTSEQARKVSDRIDDDIAVINSSD